MGSDCCRTVTHNVPILAQEEEEEEEEEFITSGNWRGKHLRPTLDVERETLTASTCPCHVPPLGLGVTWLSHGYSRRE